MVLDSAHYVQSTVISSPVDMTEDATTPRSISQLRRRRGVTHATVTCLGNRLRELEDTEDQLATPAHAQQLNTKLKDLYSSFKNLHLLVIDQIEPDETQEVEQAVLDNHDDAVANLTVCL